RHILGLRETAVEHVELTLHLHRVAIDRILDLRRRVGEEVAESSAEIRRASHLPEQPGQAFGARAGLGRQEGAKLFREIEQDRAGLEDPDRLRTAAIYHRRYLGVGIDRN